MSIRFALVVAAVSACASFATASPFSNFSPLSSSAGPIPVGDPLEATPMTLGNPNWIQQSIADRDTQNAVSPGSNSGAWDMITANETGPDAGRYLYMPFETNTAGVMRIDLHDPNLNTRSKTIVAPGTQSFVAGDMSKWTPWGGYLTAEESWGTGSNRGRLFEITNPTTATENGGNFVARTIIPRVSHEGGNFDSSKAFYFIDELNGGSVFKYVSNNPNATDGDAYFASGQSFALKATGSDNGTQSTGVSGSVTWMPITDINGAPLAGTSVIATGVDANTVDGRLTAQAIGATLFNRPEDTEYKVLANGNEVVYFTTTDSDDNNNTTDGRSRVYQLNLTTNAISLFADSHTIDLATGLEAGGGLRNADNLAIDNDGNLYLIEDRNGGDDNDIWFAKDINHDGDLADVGEGIARWASNGTQGSEFTGLYFDKFDSTKAYVNIQHPTSGNDRTIMVVTPEPTSLAALASLGLFLRRRR
jgi:secreted PhoX family phosphatase